MTIDDTHYPIVLQTIDPEATVAMIERFFAEMRRIADRAIREDTYYVEITDCPAVFPPVQRAKLTEEIKKSSLAQQKRSLGTFVIVESGLVRGALTAVKWMVPESLKNVTPVASWDEAFGRATATLRANGIPLPATLGRRRAQAGCYAAR
jgi:hypothetical protein